MKKLNLICFLLTILFLSCNKTEINNINDNILKDGKVIIPININVEDPNIISTKALNEQESKISNIYVALFTATSDNDFDGNNTLLEIVKKNINDPSPNVILNQQSTPCRIYTLVNVSGDNINRIEALPKGTKLSDFLKLSSVINDIKLENTNFPMYGESIFLKEGINKNTVLNIKAKKTFSKITINVNSLDFIIHELMIINSVTNGYLTGNNNSFSETANSEVSVANHTNSNIIKQLSLYSYPNKTNTPTDILIKGAYQGKEPTYYKVRLRYKNNASDTDYKVNINDNTNYIININSVKHNGYDYKGDAINNEPSNIIYDVTVLDNESHEIIINNGDYYLGLSNSELIIYGAGSINNILATTATIGSDLESFSIGNIGKFVTPSEGITCNVDNFTKGVPNNIMINISESFVSGYINFKIGNIEKTIKVTRKGLITEQENIIKDFAIQSYINGEFKENISWLQLSDKESSFTSSKKVYSSGNGIYVKLTTNNTPSIRTANLYIGKGNDLKVERSKVIIYQDYAKTCTITYYNQNNSGIFSVLKQVPVTIGSSVKLESIPVSYPTGKPIFNGWNTMQSGEGTKYYDNQIITATTDLSLYAMWDKAPGKHSGWAGSNIYWDPIKEILTFDDNGDDRSHENYQGVFFKWGSLVATSPTDSWNNTDGEFFLNNPSLSTSDKNLSKVIYVPNTNSSTNGGWNPNIKSNNRWANIPYVKDAFYNTFPMTEEAHKRAYLLEVHNPTKNIGDICKYITDQGWAPRADEGIKWRMPTSNDFEKYGMTDNLIFREYGQFNEVSTTNNFGQTIINNGRMTNYNNEAIKLPACGTRGRNGSLGYKAGIVGGYWGSTIGINPQSYDGLNSLGLYFSNFYDYPSELFPQYPDIREIGFAIRCVQE